MVKLATGGKALEREAELLLDRFANRRDIYAVQWADGERHGYRAVRKQLTVQLVEKHLKGELTLAFYALGSDSRAKWTAIDVDTTNVAILEDLIGRYGELDLPAPIIEWSGRRGYHFIWIYQRPVEGWKARALGEVITTAHEVFPKGTKVSSDTSSPGACLKLMLGTHQVSGQRSVLVDEHFEEFPDPWERLRQVELVDVSEYEHLLERPETGPETIKGGWSVNMLRPCIEDLLANGCRKGARNRAAHVIVSEMRRLGCSAETAVGVISCWNLRNRPQGLSRSELASVVKSAYSGEPYKYSCRPDGSLRELLEDKAVESECLGEGSCPFKRAVRNEKRQKNNRKVN